MIGLLAMAAVAYPNVPIARGPTASVAEVTRVARRCRMKDIRFDPLDDERAVLLIGRHNTRASLKCTFHWISDNEKRLALEPLFIGNATNP